MHASLRVSSLRCLTGYFLNLLCPSLGDYPLACWEVVVKQRRTFYEKSRHLSQATDVIADGYADVFVIKITDILCIFCIVEFCIIIKVPFILFKGVFFIYDVVRECRLRVRDISRLTRERNILGSPLAPFSRSSFRQSKAEKFISSVRLHSILGSLRKLLVLPWASAQVTK